MVVQILSCIAFMAIVAIWSWWHVRRENLSTQDGYFLAGRSLGGVVIAGSLLLTNISTEHLIGMNGSAYRNGALVITWEVTSAIALVIGAVYFIPRYLKMGLTTIPEFLEYRFDRRVRSIMAFLLIVSFVATLLPIVLYTGALNIESLFDLSERLGISQSAGIWLSVIVIGLIGGVYAIFGGLKMVAYTDTINGFGLLASGLLIPILALWDIGDSSLSLGISRLVETVPEKFRVISDEPSVGPGSREAILPFSVLFTGMILNQLYFWTMHQSIIQRALGAKSLAEAQKGLLITGGLKILMPLIIILPGIMAFYYFGDEYYDQADIVYPLLLKKLIPSWLIGIYLAVVIGAVLSTFNSALNSAATIFSIDFYQGGESDGAPKQNVVLYGKIVSAILAVLAVLIAPFVANAPEGLYNLLQELNGIFFIPMCTVILAGFFFKKVNAAGAKAGLVFGFLFYILVNFIIQIDMHFVHIWGLEFVLNVVVMHLVSRYTSGENSFTITDVGAVPMRPWRHTTWVSILLVIISVLSYFYFTSIASV